MGRKESNQTNKSKICDWSYTPRRTVIITVLGRHVILDRGRRFLDMFKTLRPAHLHAFCSHDHSQSIKTNVRQSSTLFLHFYLV